MIGKVTINDKEKLPLKHARDMQVFSTGKSFHFRPGINIIIGRNGCGKSTLLNMMKMYLFCSDSWVSRVPEQGYMFPKIFKEDNTLLDGIDIQCDYRGVVYNFIPRKEMKNESIITSSVDTYYYMEGAGRSEGEQHADSLITLFGRAFKNLDVNFPIWNFMGKPMNDVYKERMRALAEYYKRNTLVLDSDSFEYSFLLDEPDRNLDIDKIEELYGILSYHKKMTQLIAVVHNPVLIYKLSKKKDINFIEMSDAYLEIVKGVFEKL